MLISYFLDNEKETQVNLRYSKWTQFPKRIKPRNTTLEIDHSIQQKIIRFTEMIAKVVIPINELMTLM